MEKIIEDYYVCIASVKQDLEWEVKHLSVNSYELVGGVSFNSSSNRYMQAMVKYKKEEK